MRLRYKNSLEMMCQGNEDLTKIIRNFMDNLPSKIVKKIDKNEETGVAIDDDKRWEYVLNDDSLSISVGSSKNHHDYMSLALRSVRADDLNNWPKFEDKKKIGYLTVYMQYGVSYKKDSQVTYEYYVKRVNDKLILTINCPKFSSADKENRELLEKYGLLDAHLGIIDSRYGIDPATILANNRKPI